MLAFIKKDFETFWTSLLLNLAWLIVQAVFLVVYFRLIRGERIIDRLLGKGDILFLLAILPTFLFGEFILFYFTGLVFSLLSCGVYWLLTSKKSTVPLAGLLAIWSIFLLTGSEFISLDQTVFAMLYDQ